MSVNKLRQRREIGLVLFDCVFVFCFVFWGVKKTRIGLRMSFYRVALGVSGWGGSRKSRKE